MASYTPSAGAAAAHAVTPIPEMNPARKAASGKTGMVKGAGVQYGLGEFEKINETPSSLGQGGGDDFSKNDATAANGTISTDRGKFEQMI